MISFKEAASLTGSLLARKGSAVPAAIALSPLAALPHVAMAQPVPPAAMSVSLAAMPSPAAAPAPQAAPASTMAGSALRPTAQMESWRSPPPFQPARPPADKPPAKAGGPKEPPSRRGHGKTAKVSLRLDDERHRKLRLASVHQQLSGQQILLKALDAYLATYAPAAMDGNCVCINRTPAE
jgi:hypothetical protein